MSMKNSNDTIGNRTRDLPACSAVPQPTAPQRSPFFKLLLCEVPDDVSCELQHLALCCVTLERCLDNIHVF
jgi:hypothetical protein